MALGEAFVAVKADLRPFTKDLEKELTKVVTTFEKRVNESLNNLRLGGGNAKDFGSKLGNEFGDGFANSFGRKMGDKKKPPWLSIPAAFAAALDDGISALPTEVKAAIVAGIIGALPFVSAGLAGAVTAGVGIGFAGLGTFLAFQFEEVRERGTDFADAIRTRLIEAAKPFGTTVIAAMDTIENRVNTRIGPLLDNIFAKSAPFVGMLTEGLLGGIEKILSVIESRMDDIGPLVEEAGAAFEVLSMAVAETLRILIDTGEAGQEGFRDLVYFTGILVLNLAQVIGFLSEVYGTLRNMAEDPVIAFFMGPLFPMFVDSSNDAASSTNTLTNSSNALSTEFEGLIPKTQKQEQELKRMAKALEDASKATIGLLQNQVDFERSLDDISDSLKENGKTLDINTEKGRQNVEEFISGLKEAQEVAQDRLEAGELTAQQAAELYNQEIAQIRALATQAGITSSQFDVLFGDIINVAQIQLDAQKMGIIPTNDALGDAVNTARQLRAQLDAIARFRLPKMGTRPFSEYADGGVVHGPTPAIVGEAGSEVIIPLTKPARAAQLAQQSGLAAMLGGNAGSTVQVFIGNEQLDARMFRIVEKNNGRQAQNLAYGARS